MARKGLKNLINLIDAEKQVLPPEQSFLNDLKRSIEMTNEKNARKPSQTFKPSGMNCIRASYYQITGKEEDLGTPMSYSFIGICNSGSDTHIRIQTAVMEMVNNGMDCEWVDVEEYVKSRNLDYLEIKEHTSTETKLYHKVLNMSFMCDGIIRYKDKYYILELKTESLNKFFSQTGVQPGHYNQAIAYSTAFNIDEVIFVYINRDTLDMKSYLFKVTDDMKKSLLSYIEECGGYIKRLIAPPKPEGIDKRTCSYCHYKTQCRKDG